MNMIKRSIDQLICHIRKVVVYLKNKIDINIHELE